MDTPLVKRAYNLGLKAVPNFVALAEKEIAWYEQHLDELQTAICRGFILPQQEVRPAPVTPTQTLFRATETDVHAQLLRAEEFAKKYLGVEIEILSRFAVPAELPWKSVIPVFDPGGLTNRNAIQKALKDFGLAVWEEVDVMKYSGSEANKEPTLHLINNSIRPDEDTMGLSADQLVATQKNWLDLRGYALAFGLHHFVTNEYLDSQTWTWFPNNRLAGGKVAHGSWNSDRRRVSFYWALSGYRYGNGGARLAISVPLLP